MALIKTATEAKAALPRVLSNLGSTANLPDFSAAEIKYLVPLIGYSQYDQINGKINADPQEELTEYETNLLPYLRRVSAFYAYLDDLGTDNAKITDNGVRTTESANLPRVFGWQYKELKDTLQKKAFDAVEVMLRFLSENLEHYPAWTSSDEYAEYNGLLIKTGTDFNKHHALYQPMRTFYMMKELVDEVQEDFIKPAIGNDLLTYFIQGEGLDDDTKGFQKYIKKALAYMVVRKACQHKPVQFNGNGFTILSGDSENPATAGTQPPDLKMYELKMSACETDANTWLLKAKRAMVSFRETSANEAFNAAYDAGPLINYSLTAAPRDRKNAYRKTYRF